MVLYTVYGDFYFFVLLYDTMFMNIFKIYDLKKNLKLNKITELAVHFH